MKNFSFALLVASSAFLCSCSRYFQVADISSPNVPQQNKTFVFENDTVKITYEFWGEQGTLSYSIFNKTDKPMYIDWKKSSYIRNGVKLDYYSENEKITATTKTKGNSGTVGITGQQGALFGNTVSGSSTYSRSESQTTALREVQQRITFIAPHSQYTSSSFSIGRTNGIIFTDTLKSVSIERLDKKGKYTRALIEKFTQSESPLSFRVFISLSDREDFTNEFYVDNAFYVSRVIEMNKRQFASNWEYESPYFRQTRYYTTLKTE